MALQQGKHSSRKPPKLVITWNICYQKYMLHWEYFQWLLCGLVMFKFFTKNLLLPGIFMKIFKVPGKVPIGRALSKKQWILTGGSVKIWREAEFNKKLTVQTHFETNVCVPYQVSHNSVMITPILQHPKLPLARHWSPLVKACWTEKWCLEWRNHKVWKTNYHLSYITKVSRNQDILGVHLWFIFYICTHLHSDRLKTHVSCPPNPPTRHTPVRMIM